MPSLERLSRRNFLGIGAIAAAGALLPARAVEAAAAATAIAAVSTAADRSLSFFHTHTNERLTTAYCCNGEYVGLRKIKPSLSVRNVRCCGSMPPVAFSDCPKPSPWMKMPRGCGVPPAPVR